MTGQKGYNFSYSWRTGTRYSLATLAKYDTVLFIDDDMILRRGDFIAYMFENHNKLKPFDLLSCWNRLWTEWNEDYHNVLSLNFQTRGITELTRCDVAGPGICMFNKQILSPRLLDVVIFPEFAGAYDMGFSLIASLEHGSQCYFLPSYNMLESHQQGRKAALMDGPERYRDMHALFKSMLKRGYKPVLSRLSPTEFSNSPERRAVELLKPVKVAW